MCKGNLNKKNTLLFILNLQGYKIHTILIKFITTMNIYLFIQIKSNKINININNY